MKFLKAIFLWSFTVLSLTVIGQQNYGYKASLGNVDSNGFYAVSLSPAILAKCNINYSDIRIKSTDNIEIPFVQKIYAGNNDVTFMDFPIISKTVHADKKMHVVVKSTDSLATHLGLEIQNTLASRSANINGSNDGKQWFVVKENVQVSNAEKYGQSSYFISILLPQTNYKYFDIVFTDKELLPVNIIKAGSIYMHNNLPVPQYDTVTTSTIQQKDSGKVSYVQFSFAEPYHIEKILLNISGPKYYQREAVLNIGNGYNNPFTINSGKASWVSVNAKPGLFYAEIFNEDNPALKIISVQGLIKKTAVYAYLEKGKKYSLLFGDSLARAPNYDLKYFEKLIQKNAPVVAVGNIEKNITTTETPATQPSSNKKIIWFAMVIVVIALLFITVKLTKEIDKNGN